MTLYNQDEIVSAHKVEIKPAFEERYKALLGDRYDEFMKVSFQYLRKCIRVNTLKISVEELKNRMEDLGWVLTPVPWCKEGFFVEGHKDMHRFDIGNLPEHILGYFYVQEASSMIPPVVLFSDLRSANGDQNGEQGSEHSVQSLPDDFKVLDLCSAPGSKTSQLAQYMNNQGILIANDVSLGRLQPLTLNLQRIGVSNAIVSFNAFQYNKHKPALRNPFDGEAFDRILVDAPCSGTGTIRKSFKSLSMYSYGLVNRMVQTQKSLIKNAWKMLKPGGVLVYSTCTQEPGENENIVSFLMSQFDDVEILPIELDIKRSEPILCFEDKEFNPAVKDCLRIYPQDNDSEGFFVAKLRKKVV